MAGLSKIGSRYAQALFSLARERNEVESVYNDMTSFSAAFEGSDDLRIMLKSPVIKADKKLSVLKSVFTDLSKITVLFFDKITKGRREKYLGDIAKSFIQQVDASKGLFTVEVKTASPLSAEHRVRIQELAKGVLSEGAKDVQFKEVVDPELIGGFILTVGDRQIDTSFAHKLRELERSFNENIYVKNF
ncbi:MAG: ATP synthase F1 subunit delta [Flavobacteriales bacterium]|nr:ATP synthase F1 subunit delta [Flavobacteriales bacterium]